MLPEGVSIDNLLPVQKEFVMLMMANSPTIEGLHNWANFENEKDDLKGKNFADEISTPDDINLMLARNKGMTLDKYKEELSDNIREDKLRLLKEKYGLAEEDDKKSERTEILEHYQDVSKKLESNDSIKKMKNINNFFENPKGGTLKNV